MTRATALIAFLALGLTAAPTAAQPAPDEDKSDKLDAKALMQSGLKLFAAKDYLGALAVFKTAYERFPSGKILLNIGTTLLKLDRKAEAANAYQRYLDTTDADAKRQAQVTRVLEGLDKDVARLDIGITPADSEVQIDDSAWQKVADVKRYRVDKGARTVRARRKGFKPNEETFSVGAGETRSVSLTLTEEPVATSRGGDDVRGDDDDDTRVRAGARPARRSRLGAIVAAHIDPSNKGAAALVGLTADVVSRLQVQATALVGPTSGGYVGASFGILPGTLRPIVVVGLPVFFSDGARFAVRGALGAEYAFDAHFAVFAEVGAEYMLNPEPMVTKTLFIPAVGVTGRL
jgi:tetratricopeptide (TPR) repeat protein